MLREIRTIIILLLLVTITGVAQKSGSDKILPYPINQYKLKNGLNVVTVKYDSPDLAAFFVVERVGSRNEVEEGVQGFAHFFEHMMFRGTDKYPVEKYIQILKLIGAGANANTGQDRTIFHMAGNAEKLETMFDIESDRFMNLHYAEHDFKTEAGAVKGEYTKNNASPYQQLYENLVNTAFDKHTYKHTTMGFFKDIVDMPNQYEYSKLFFKRFYRPEYATIVVVGDVTAAQVNKLAEKYFGKWERGNYEPVIPVEPQQTETRFTHLQNGGIPPYLSLNYKGPAFSDTKIDKPALDVLNTIIFSQTSELYRKLVLTEQKVRFIFGGAQDSRDPNLITISASLKDKKDMQYIKDEVVKAIEKVKNEGVDPKLLLETKEHLKYSYAMSIDDPENIANSLSHYIMLTGDPEALNRLYAMYDKVTVEDIKKVATQYFTPTGLTIATVSEDKEGGVK
jgi:zinc protease